MTFEARMAANFANAAIVALVSTRAYPVDAGPSRALPYLTWRRIASSPEDTHDEQNPSLEEITIQVDFFAATHESATTLRRTVRTVLLADTTEGAVTRSNATDLGHDDNLRSYAVSEDFTFWHNDAS